MASAQGVNDRLNDRFGVAIIEGIERMRRGEFSVAAILPSSTMRCDGATEFGARPQQQVAETLKISDSRRGGGGEPRRNRTVGGGGGETTSPYGGQAPDDPAGGSKDG